MSATNNANLIGRITRDLELKSSQNGTSIVSFTLAVDREFKNKSGQRETDFISCVAWHKSAEILAQYAHKGDMVSVQGEIRTRNYTNRDGQKVYVTEVHIDSFHFLPSGQRNNTQQGQTQPPQGQPGQAGGYFDQGPVNVSNDDLPF